MPTLGDRLQHAWNAFRNRDPTVPTYQYGIGYGYRPDRLKYTFGKDRSIVTSVLNRLSLDAASMSIEHVRLDDNDRYLETIHSGLNECLTLSANIDQTGRSFLQDVFASMLDEGCVAIVPVETTTNPKVTGSYDIKNMRTGKIIQWFPDMVQVQLYDERTGKKENVTLPKKIVALVENPLFAVMNEPNSTLQRLIRKLALLDSMDERNSSGKLDMIIQLPYVIKTDARREQAEKRRSDIEHQLSSSQYGIAYTDGTEKIVQLNRPVENTLMNQIEYLTSMLYSQLGLTKEIMDGTANEATLNNYYVRTIEPLLAAVTDEMKRKFLTKTARKQHQSIIYFRDPFKLVPTSAIADMADRFTRNEIMTSNEFRQIIGLKPSSDPAADELRNKNMPMVQPAVGADGLPIEGELQPLTEEDIQSMSQEELQQYLDDLDSFDAELDDLESELKHSDENDNYLAHTGPTKSTYASPYYDPIKAHEYYEQHKQLQGRRSTAGLNDAGKEAARYVRDQLKSERISKVNAHKAQTDSNIQTNTQIGKNKIESNKSIMQSKIESLRAQLKSMSKEEKAARRESINAEIQTLRASNAESRALIQKSMKSYNVAMRNEHKRVRESLKTEYDEKYLDELEKIKADENFQRTKKSKSSGTKKKKTKSKSTIESVVKPTSNYNRTSRVRKYDPSKDKRN